MEEFNVLLKNDNNELLYVIPSYQTQILSELLIEFDNNYLKVADTWLSSTTSQTAQFGSFQNNSKLYIEKLWDEVEKFLCGSDVYSEDRKKISLSSDKSQKYVIGVMSTALGSQLGVVGTFIAPVIVLLLLSIGKMSINAWCEMRKEIKK